MLSLYLGTCVMPQIVVLDIESTMIKGVYELVREGIFQMLLAEESILAKKYSVIGRESTRESIGAGMALDRIRSKGAIGQFEVFEHEHDHRT